MDTMNIICGLDIGNGYTKGKLSVDGASPVTIDMPSCTCYIGRQAWLPREADDEYMLDLVNELDCDIASPAIKPADAGRILVGRRAVESGATPVIFNIDDHTPKCDDALSAQLILSVISGIAVSEQWKRTHALPDGSLHVNAYLGVALPISDYMAYRERYRRQFEGLRHSVHIHNFERDVTVDIDFAQVTVLAEGAAAQYAITDLGASFLDAALSQCRADGLSVDASVDGEALVGYMNTVGIDVGEGTVNFPVFRDGHISVETSSSINKGYGTALSGVVAATRNMEFAPQSRKDLAEFMLKEDPTPTQVRLQGRFKDYIDDEVRLLSRDIVTEFKSVLKKVKLDCDVVYVYGGGANAVRATLYPALLEAAELAEGLYLPVVYLDSSYSRDLNRNGLYNVARLAASKL